MKKYRQSRIKMKLYSFSHSSASFRVRAALELKGISYETIAIDLRKDDHLDTKYLELNPQGRVPFLIDGDFGLSQSFAIMEYLEEKHPNPSILPIDIEARAKARAFANIIGADIFPLQNLGVRRKLNKDFNQSEAEQSAWCAFWIDQGFEVLEKMLEEARPKTKYLFADYPTIADICLVPQMNNALRFGNDLTKFPNLCEFDKIARNHNAFIKSAPENQK